MEHIELPIINQDFKVLVDGDYDGETGTDDLVSVLGGY